MSKRDDTLSFVARKPMHVLIALHDFLPVPAWLGEGSGYEKTALTTSMSNGKTFNVYRSPQIDAFSVVSLGGTECRSMGSDGLAYSVILEEARSLVDDAEAAAAAAAHSGRHTLDTVGSDPASLLRRSSWCLYRHLTVLAAGGARDDTGAEAVAVGAGAPGSTAVAPGTGQVALAQTLRYDAWRVQRRSPRSTVSKLLPHRTAPAVSVVWLLCAARPQVLARVAAADVRCAGARVGAGHAGAAALSWHCSVCRRSVARSGGCGGGSDHVRATPACTCGCSCGRGLPMGLSVRC